MTAGGVALGLALWADSYIASPWQLYLCFGVFTAIAVAAAGSIPAIVQVQRDFQDKLGLALGIVSAGVGVGMLMGCSCAGRPRAGRSTATRCSSASAAGTSAPSSAWG